MNNLYLVLPIVGNDSQDEERCCLKTLDASALKNVFVNLLKCLLKAFEWVKDEDFNLYYDNVRLKDLYNKCEANGYRPGPLPLLGELPQLTKMPEPKHAINMNSKLIPCGIVCSYVNNMDENSVMVNHDGLACDVRQLNIKDASGKKVDCVVIKCEREEIYKWFAVNRCPMRQLDTNYSKHTGRQKSQKGNPVSTCSYEVEDARNILHWAVGSKNRKYFRDNDRKRLVIFMDENLNPPTFHYFDVDINDSDEIEKMQKECGKDIIEQLKGIFKLWKRTTRS